MTKIFEQSKELFKDSGGDVESLVLASYKAHVNRFFPSRMSQKVNLCDVTEGLKIFKKNKSKKEKLADYGLKVLYSKFYLQILFRSCTKIYHSMTFQVPN